MPGRSPHEAIEAFLAPLRDSIACVGSAHLKLSPGARGAVGITHSWVLNDGEPMELGGGFSLKAKMHFEILDRGQPRGSDRFKVSTSSYLYSILQGQHEVMAAHWHPTGSSPVTFPHWHFGSVALSDTGVFLERSHIPSPRVSFEYMVRQVVESGLATPTCDDWEDRLNGAEAAFDAHKSW